MRLRTLSLLLLAASTLVPACTRAGAHAPPTVTPQLTPPVVVEAVEPVQLEILAELDNRYLAADASGEVLARIRIRSPESAEGERPRANVGLVIDTSGSMAGDAIGQARQAALTMLDSLRDGDVFSIVAFGSVSEVLVPATVLDDQARPRIRASIETMKASGTTDLAGGLAAGIAQVAQAARADEINRIVLVSDGVPNDDTALAGLAQQARGSAIPITALGLGLDYHETLLGQIAQVSGGGFHFVEEPDAVAAVFRDEVLRIDQLAARSPSLTLTPGPGVTILDVPGRAVGSNGRSVVVGLPDLAEGDTHQIVVRLGVGQHRDGATVELFDGVLAYVDARTQGQAQERMFVAGEATADEDVRKGGVDASVALSAARAITAAATLDIVAMARSGQVKAARSKLDDAVARAKAVSKTTPDAELSRLIDGLVELRPNLAGLAPPPPAKVGSNRPHKGKTGGKVRAQPAPRPAPASGVVGLGSTPMSTEGARNVRASHARAYGTLNSR